MCYAWRTDTRVFATRWYGWITEHLIPYYALVVAYGNDSVCQSGGRDKLRNASILRKYGSICMGGKDNKLF